MSKQRINNQQLEQDEQLIEQFLDSIWMEQGLSQHTLNAYQTDLKGLAKWSASGYGGNLLTLSRSHLQSYLAFRLEKGIKARTTARMLSTIRRFYQFYTADTLPEPGLAATRPWVWHR